ncbi:MAG: lysylphosphatidylglycerol synthase transmembrane domain-containing protein [Mariniblastus sp.]
MKQIKSHALTALKFGASIAILWFLFNKPEQREQFEAFFSTPKRWGWIAFAFASCVAAHLIGFFRWRLMVRALDLPFSVLDAIRIGFIGLFFNLVAFGVLGGDTLRAFYVTRQMKDRAPEAISSVIADRVIGLLTMFLVASCAYLCFDTTSLESMPDKLNMVNFVGRATLIVTAIGFGGVGVIFFTPKLASTHWYQKLLEQPKIGGIGKRLTSVVLMYRSKPRTIAMSFSMSVGVNLFFAITIFAMACGLTDSFPSFGNHFLIEPISMVSNAVPLPGGVGGMETAMTVLYEAFSCSTGLIVAIGFRISLFAVSAIGAVFWFLNRSKIAEAIQANNAQGSENTDQ